MTRHRFFIDKKQIRNDAIFISGSQARQIHQVLRLRPGDKISVLDNEGWEIEVELQATRPNLVNGRKIKRWRVDSEPQVHLTLYQSRLKQDKFEWILQKGTEIGVAAFVPTITERSVIRQTTLKNNKLVRWQRILCEAAEQSGRGLIPTLAQPIDFATAVQEAGSSHLALIPWTGEKAMDIASIVAHTRQRAAQPLRSIALFLGPEGGFSTSEVQTAQAAGIKAVTLGPRILRAETAAIVTATLTLHELGALRLSQEAGGEAAK